MTPEQIAAIMLDSVGNPQTGPLPPAVEVMSQAVAAALAPVQDDLKVNANK